MKNNSFDHKETFVAFYASYDWKLNDNLKGWAGVRAESANSRGEQQITSEKIERDYFDILPSLSVMYEINPDHRLSYNFSVKVSRPGYYSMNPFKFFLNPTTYKEYNPDLKPPKSYINRLLYTFKRHYIFGLDYTYISQCRNDFKIPVDDKYTKLINTNYGNLHLLRFNLSWNDSFWDDRLYINAS